MPDPIIAKLQDWLRAHEQELLQDTLGMLRIPSIEGTPTPEAPFGIETKHALDFALAKCAEWGMTVKELEGYIGFGEFGSGERLVMSLGHLDVVPVGPGWKHEPFGAEIENGYIFARGSCDDKGPTMASLYAMRAIKECCPDIRARMRQVFGLNEESGFKCVERYMETEEAPTFGVAPDSGWPLYNGEKGIANLEICVPLNKGADLELLSISGGQRPNIVIDSASAKARVSPEARAKVEEKLADSWDRNLTFAWDGDVLSVSAIGKAAHGSQPFLGDSAAIRVMRFLRDISPLSCERFFNELFETSHIGGDGIGIAGADDVSVLTCNLGIIGSDSEHVHLLYNIRYPVSWTGAKLEAMCKARLAKYESGFELRVTRDSPPLYFPLDHPLVRVICEVYEEETGDKRQPGTMGGGTYARAIPNSVSIGTGWSGDGGAHETDEHLKVEHLYKMSRIYAHILYRLATVEA